MAQPPEQPARPPAAPGGRYVNSTAIKAAIVLVAFVVTTVLMLGVIHPTASIGNGGQPFGDHHHQAGRAHDHDDHGTAPCARPGRQRLGCPRSSRHRSPPSCRRPVGTCCLPVNAAAQVTVTNVYYVAGQKSAAQSVAKALDPAGQLGGPVHHLGPGQRDRDGRGAHRHRARTWPTGPPRPRPRPPPTDRRSDVGTQERPGSGAVTGRAIHPGPSRGPSGHHRGPHRLRRHALAHRRPTRTRPDRSRVPAPCWPSWPGGSPWWR